MVPTVALPPAVPFTAQETPVLLVPVTAAEYWDDVPSVTLLAPEIAMVIVGVLPPLTVGGGVARATERLLDADGSAALVAVMVTLEDCGALAGAV
jgi:hypothetical protein